jgi:hypothetical protein
MKSENLSGMSGGEGGLGFKVRRKRRMGFGEGGSGGRMGIRLGRQEGCLV